MRNKNTYNNSKVRRVAVGNGKKCIKNDCVSTAASYHRSITSGRVKNGKAITWCQLNRCSCLKNQNLQDMPELLQKHLLRTSVSFPETEDATSLVSFFCEKVLLQKHPHFRRVLVAWCQQDLQMSGGIFVVDALRCWVLLAGRMLCMCCG